MKRVSITALALMVTATLASAQAPQATIKSRAPQATIAACPCETCKCAPCDCGFVSQREKRKSYSAACEDCATSGKPLCTFVGVNLPHIDVPEGMAVCHVASLPGYPSGCAVISVQENGRHLWFETIADPTADKIKLPKKVMAGCESGVCTPTYFPASFSASSFGVGGSCASGTCGTSAYQTFPAFSSGSFGSGCASGNCASCR